MKTAARTYKNAFTSLLIAGLLVWASVPGFSREKNETIEATSFGTGTQLGQLINVSMIIYEY